MLLPSPLLLLVRLLECSEDWANRVIIAEEEGAIEEELDAGAGAEMEY